MAALPTVSRSNRLLAELPRRVRESFLGQCDSVVLATGQVLEAVDRPCRHAHFPLSGVISLLSGTPECGLLQLAQIGCEGMVGAGLILGVTSSPLRATVIRSGLALRINAGNLRQQARSFPALSLMFGHVLHRQLAELALLSRCIRYHPVEQRLVRAILQADDRESGERLCLTHGQLAEQLAVRRSSVTISAGDLQHQGLIRYTRGSIRILDRSGLEAISCECYQLLKASPHPS